ncbi:hypothetical protein AVEN_148196-1 [Araneus ventricosus]|uniref:Uncharacterized protein n=1 Tax=Araneus ventricosus TaxID=182803 RepID=A0A4Y2DCT2_ARAVE|nr:hypothetical protein AVEN_148196-1 [Araneus ventricosus]
MTWWKSGLRSWRGTDSIPESTEDATYTLSAGEILFSPDSPRNVSSTSYLSVVRLSNILSRSRIQDSTDHISHSGSKIRGNSDVGGNPISAKWGSPPRELSVPHRHQSNRLDPFAINQLG